MTVQELIQKLQELDQDKQVKFYGYDMSDVWDEYVDVDRVLDKGNFIGLF